ncbi:hypothetical protein [Streptomyces pristinaespiralis]|uniref:hypothetical protein n=1 Tax=Streptomyces pristinaespiralis TaxID=38300 RepID=UPI00383339EA
MLVASRDASTLARVLTALRRSVADGTPDDEEGLLAAIDAVMDPCHAPASPAPASPAAPSKAGALLDRLPHRPRRRQDITLKAAAFCKEDVSWIVFQFRRATEPTINRAMARVRPVPTGLIEQARALHEEMPGGDDVVGYLRRYAQALLDLVDLAAGNAV